MIKHTYADDIESLFYIFIWILVLYDGPLGHECKGTGHKNMLLSFWSEEASRNLKIAQSAKFMFLIVKWSKLDIQIVPYFTDLLPLAESWYMLLGEYVHMEVKVPFDRVLKIFDDFLVTMHSEKPPAIVNTMHRIVEQHSLLNSTFSSHPANKTDDNSKHNTMYLKCLRDEVSSMGNPPVHTKHFKAV